MLDMYGRMFAMDFFAWRIDGWVWFAVVGFTLVHMSPQAWMDRLRESWVRTPAPGQALGLAAAAALLVWVGSAQQAPFIYFQF